MKKTLMPNSIIVFSIIYSTIMLWGIISTERRTGLIFYAILLAVFFTIFIYERDKLACTLEIENYQLKFKYLFPNVKNIEIDLYKIQGDLTLKRFHGRDFAGGFPTWIDYINYKWYFKSEKYELEFYYSGELMKIPFQANIIGLKTFFDSVIYHVNAINNSKTK